MSGFDNWKSRLADSLQNLPNFDDMAKKDDYIQSPEFRVRNKKSEAPHQNDSTATQKTRINEESMENNRPLDPVETSQTQQESMKVTIPNENIRMDPYSNNGSSQQKEEEEEGWDDPVICVQKDVEMRSTLKSNLDQQVSSALNYPPLIKPSFSFSNTTLDFPKTNDYDDSMKILNNRYENQKTIKSVFPSKKDNNGDTTTKTTQVTNNEYSTSTNQWSLLDTETSTLIPHLSKDQKEELSKPSLSSEALTSPVVQQITNKPKKRDFAPLSIVEQLMSGKDLELQYKKTPTLPAELLSDSESDDDENENEMSMEGKDESILASKHHYDSDMSYESDLEDDFIMGLHQRKAQSSTSSLASASQNDIDYSKQIEDVAPQRPSHDTPPPPPPPSSKKPLWFDVFDEKQKEPPDFHSFAQKKGTDTGSIHHDSSTTAQHSKNTIGQWWNQVAPPELKNVSQNLVTKLKQQKNLGTQIRSKVQSSLQSLQAPTPSTIISSSSMDLESNSASISMEIKPLNDDEFVTKDSNALLAQEDLAEFERLKQRSSFNVFQRIFDFWMEYDDYIFLLCTFFCMIFVYFRIYHNL